MTLSKAAHKVIDLARQISDYYTSELPKWHPNYPLVNLGEESAPPPPEEKELQAFLASLPEETIYQLVLLMYLGRGDFGTDDLAGTHEDLKRTFGKAEHAASQMMGKAPLADYLADGLAELRKQGINVDKLSLKKVKLGKR